MIIQGMLTRATEQIFVGIWSTNWPLVVLPIIAYVCAERLSPRLDLLSYEKKSKSILAILLTALPGLVFLSLGVYAICALQHAEIDSALCVMVYFVPIVIVAGGITNAALALRRRLLFVKQLLAVTKEADDSLRILAEQKGMVIRVLPIEELACMTVGVLRPVVLLSSGAINRLPVPELEAVLLHERVHLKRRDTFWTTLSKFVSDCSFRCSPQAEAIACRIREITADREVARSIDPCVLASVLVKFARHPPSVTHAFVESFALPTTISERVRYLMHGAAVVRNKKDTLIITSQVGLAASLILYPYIIRVVAKFWLHC